MRSMDVCGAAGFEATTRAAPWSGGWVGRFCSQVRDADSRVSPREAAAVAEWVRSGVAAHVMRDHPNHQFVMNSGMWGAVGGQCSSTHHTSQCSSTHHSAHPSPRYCDAHPIWSAARPCCLAGMLRPDLQV